MPEKHLALVRKVLVLIFISLLPTIGSYAVVTHRNVALDRVKQYTTIQGEPIINLPCAPAGSIPEYPNWQSDQPILPEARGLPFNYSFWNPCEGYKILRDGFLLDWTVWFVFCSILYMVYKRLAGATGE